MFDVLSRLYRTKMLLSCVVLVVLGALLLVLGARLDTVHGWWHDLHVIPWSEFGGIFVGAGIFSIWLDHFLSREQDALDDERLRRLLSEQAPAMRDAVLEAFAANQADLERVATPETLDRITTASLGLRLHDQQFAAEVYADIRDQAVLATERWQDAEISIELRPTGGPPPPGSEHQPAAGPFFSVTVRLEYTVIPTHAQRRFVCLSDREEYVELAGERGDTSAWYLRPETGVDPSTKDAFELLRFTVDGQERPIRRAVRKAGQLYTASIGTEAVTASKPVTISCTYRAITGQADHLLFFDIEQPTRGLRVEMDYAGCAIASMAALDLVPTIRPTRIDRPPAVLDQESVRIEVDGWVFPRSGVAFVWTLAGERSHSAGPGRQLP